MARDREMELGRYVATDPWLGLGRYVATERTLRSERSGSVATFARSLRSDRAERVFCCCVAILFELLFDDSCFFRKAFLCKLAGFLKTLEYWQRDKFWDLVSRFLILCLEMLETSALGLGQDLGLLLVLEGAMTNSTYVSRFSFILIPYRFKVRDRCFAMLQGISLSPAFGKHSGLTTDVRSQNCCSCRYVASEGLTGRYVASGSKPRRVLLVFVVKSQRKLRLRRNEKRFDEDSKENPKEDLSDA
ncbi:hypothetical protein F2Q69_00012238 [Brassica cretica]|uniref:Uncharacterized protein n=1 Tax=Brassica cretica TaxID=69181 RepID=A0A8S9R9T6_BRACR|nr:hypothetical protein F2Q69_00012238 [Brassica cretica]